MIINKYTCTTHKLVTGKKAMRKHLGKEHARNDFKSLEKNGTYKRMEFI